MEPPLRIATLAHGHPAVAAGGAEVSAHALHRAFAASPELSALHVSCVPYGLRLLPRTGEVGIPAADLDDFSLTRRDPLDHQEICSVLKAFRPDIVHFHHVLGYGADAPLAVRKLLPDAAIVLTLHEYVAICHRQGQMLRADGELCHRADAHACAGCFPDRAASSFLLREKSLQTLLGAVTAFVAPSAFLADRYAQWGIAPDRMSVIENLLPEPNDSVPTANKRQGRIAFFGQINPFKGLDVLLAAIAMLDEDDWQGRHLDVHGSGLEKQPSEFRDRIEALLLRCGSRVTMHGRYDNAHVQRLMTKADWIVVPSIWWENSPVVIQEAFRAAKPVIGSNLGGIAEKVQHGVNGLLFRVGDAAHLAATLARCRHDSIRTSMRIGPPPSVGAITSAHLELYRRLLTERRPAAMPPAWPMGRSAI